MIRMFKTLACVGMGALSVIALLDQAYSAAGLLAAITLALMLLFLGGKKLPEMTGAEFEAFCRDKLKKEGLDAGGLFRTKFREVRQTQLSNDYGADLIATDRRRRTWVIQCKLYRYPVGNAAVQEVVAAKAHYEADFAVVMTNNHLTNNARRLAEENEVIVVEDIEV